MIVCLLQNPWSPHYEGRKWPRQSWLKALWASRSGQRLRRLFPDPTQVWFDNTNPIATGTPSGVLPPDLDHVKRMLKRQKPTVVVACGRIAEYVSMGMWDGRLMLVPHPAYRLLTNKLIDTARDLLDADRFWRVRVASLSKDDVYVKEW
jgi:hypothetical protein